MRSMLQTLGKTASFKFSSVKRTTQLKNLIKSKELEFIMEAHNGLSALIV